MPRPMQRIAEEDKSSDTGSLGGHHTGDTPAVGVPADDAARVLLDDLAKHRHRLLRTGRQLSRRRYRLGFHPPPGQPDHVWLHAFGAARCPMAEENHDPPTPGAHRGSSTPAAVSFSTALYFSKVNWESPEPSPLTSQSWGTP